MKRRRAQKSIAGDRQTVGECAARALFIRRDIIREYEPLNIHDTHKEESNMVDLRVCIGSSCHLNGAHGVIATFQQMIEENKLHDKVKFEASFCMHQCAKSGVSVSVNGEVYRVEPDNARAFFTETVLPLAR